MNSIEKTITATKKGKEARKDLDNFNKIMELIKKYTSSQKNIPHNILLGYLQINIPKPLNK